MSYPAPIYPSSSDIIGIDSLFDCDAAVKDSLSQTSIHDGTTQESADLEKLSTAEHSVAAGDPSDTKEMSNNFGTIPSPDVKSPVTAVYAIESTSESTLGISEGRKTTPSDTNETRLQDHDCEQAAPFNGLSNPDPLIDLGLPISPFCGVPNELHHKLSTAPDDLHLARDVLKSDDSCIINTTCGVITDGIPTNYETGNSFEGTLPVILTDPDRATALVEARSGTQDVLCCHQTSDALLTMSQAASNPPDTKTMFAKSQPFDDADDADGLSATTSETETQILLSIHSAPLPIMLPESTSDASSIISATTADESLASDMSGLQKTSAPNTPGSVLDDPRDAATDSACISSPENRPPEDLCQMVQNAHTDRMDCDAEEDQVADAIIHSSQVDGDMSDCAAETEANAILPQTEGFLEAAKTDNDTVIYTASPVLCQESTQEIKSESSMTADFYYQDLLLSPILELALANTANSTADATPCPIISSENPECSPVSAPCELLAPLALPLDTMMLDVSSNSNNTAVVQPHFVSADSDSASSHSLVPMLASDLDAMVSELLSATDTFVPADAPVTSTVPEDSQYPRSSKNLVVGSTSVEVVLGCPTQLELPASDSQPEVHQVPEISMDIALDRMSADDIFLASDGDEEQLLLTKERTDDFLPSSPIPLSSPPQIFSSSPPRSSDITPPSSSPPRNWMQEEKENMLIPCTSEESPDLDDAVLGKRNAPAESSRDRGRSSPFDERPYKHLKTEWASPPRPKRYTLASQQVQHKKLKAPFRSPLVNYAAVHEGVHGVYSSGKSPVSPSSNPTEPEPEPAAIVEDGKVELVKALATKDRTARASKQFKSPISGTVQGAGGSQSSDVRFSSVGAAPTIQTLQAKVQVLKQAIRITQSGGGKDEDELENVAKKWRDAGRELAWAVWDTVKDLDPGADLAAVKPKRGWFDDEGAGGRGQGSGWGWDEAKNKSGVDEQMEVEEKQEPEPPQHTLGTMLRHMGIAPETLGWDEDEGDFVDDA